MHTSKSLRSLKYCCGVSGWGPEKDPPSPTNRSPPPWAGLTTEASASECPETCPSPVSVDLHINLRDRLHNLSHRLDQKTKPKPCVHYNLAALQDVIPGYECCVRVKTLTFHEKEVEL